MAKRKKRPTLLDTAVCTLPGLGSVVSVEMYDSGKAYVMHTTGAGWVDPANRERVAAWLTDYISGGHEACYALLWDGEPPYCGGEYGEANG